MELRRAKTDEYEQIHGFYWELIDLMQNRTDTVGWKKGIYPADDFLRESINNGEMFVLKKDSSYAACVILNSKWNEGYNGITWGIDCRKDDILIPHALGVHPRFQNMGTGKKVVNDIICFAREQEKKTIRLDILNGNIAAERLYTGAGFRFVQAKQMYYEDTGRTEFKMFELIL